MSRLFRSGLAAAVASISALLLAVPASACNEPYVTSSTTRANPGSTVHFSVVNTGRGATYTLSIDGREVDRGTDATTASGYNGSFEMPDLGRSAREVNVDALISHTGEPTWPDSFALQYAAPASTNPSPHDGETGGVVPRPSRGDPGTPQPAPALGASPPAGGDPGSSGDPSGPEGGSGGSPGSVVARSDGVRPSSETAAHASTGALSRAAARELAGESAATSTERQRELNRAATGRLGRDEKQNRERAAVARGDAESGLVGGLPLGLAIFTVVAAAGALLLALRRRGLPPEGDLTDPGPAWIPPGVASDARARDALIEAELQAMIA